MKPEKDKFHFFYLGNLFPTKGCLLLLDACKILKEKGAVFVCDVVGGETAEISAGQYEQEIRMRHLTDVVYYHGTRYGEEKEFFFRQADVFVFPTFYSCECFPVVLLEAMRHALPVISTFEGGIPDIVVDGETGYLVPQQAVDELQERMERFLCTPSLCSVMGEKGAARFRAHFTDRIFEERMKTILIRLSTR